MDAQKLIQIAHLVAVLAFVLLAAQLARLAMRKIKQPEVIGEILVGILFVPAVLAATGRDGLAAVLPDYVLDPTNVIGRAGLVLFLVGVAYELRRGVAGQLPRSVGWATAGSIAPAMALGTLLAVWLMSTGNAELRGKAPAPAFILLIAVSITITAVPVLARILSDRDMTRTNAGVLAMAASVVTDITGWLLLAVAIGLTAGGMGGVLVALIALVVAGVIALGLRLLLREEPAAALCARFSRTTSVAVGVIALVFAATAEEFGLTIVFGALLVGFAVPGDEKSPWATAVRRVSAAGRLSVPVFFVAAGVGVAAGSSGWHIPWLTAVIATGAAVIAKIGGGYLGARLARQSTRDSLTVGVLLNTRGLTEIVVLQAGYSAGILTPTLFLALVAMALTTTAMTGPLLSLIARRARQRQPAA